MVTIAGTITLLNKRLAFGLFIFGVFGIGFLAARPDSATRLFQLQQNPAEKTSTADAHSHSEAVKGLVLSDSAKASLGLELGPVTLQDYWRRLSVPAEVTEEPGHCELGVSSTIQGIVLKIHAFHGQTVKAGDPLVTLRPTSELLATAQSALLKSIQEMELVQSELKRISSVAESGGIPAARKFEKELEMKRLDSLRQTQIQELLGRGLTPNQIDEIVRTKTLIRELTIRASGEPVVSNPRDDDVASVEHEIANEQSSNGTTYSPNTSNHEHGSIYSIEQLNVHLGKLVQPGEELCKLARHSQLLIAARAFERESFLVTRAIENNWPLTAIFEMTDESPVVRDGLSILYADNVIEQNSRTLRFYIPLPNELVRDQPAANGLSYRSWRFKPGQRVQVRLPIEHLLQQIVLPAEAIVKEGSEAFVFRANGKRLDRIPVRLRHLDSRDAIVQSGQLLATGDIVARNQAYQLNLALKSNQSERPHGHSHDHGGHDHDH